MREASTYHLPLSHITIHPSIHPSFHLLLWTHLFPDPLTSSPLLSSSPLSTHPLIYSSAHSLIRSFAHSLFYSSAHSLIRSFAHSLIRSSAHPLICSTQLFSTPPLIFSSAPPLIPPSIHSLLRHSFTRPLIFSFAHHSFSSSSTPLILSLACLNEVSSLLFHHLLLLSVNPFHSIPNDSSRDRIVMQANQMQLSFICTHQSINQLTNQPFIQCIDDDFIDTLFVLC